MNEDILRDVESHGPSDPCSDIFPCYLGRKCFHKSISSSPAAAEALDAVEAANHGSGDVNSRGFVGEA